MKLKIGDKAPDFTLPSTSGKDFSLYKDQAGKPCIIYFYPKDFTYGCTSEACEFRDRFDEFIYKNIDVYGISTDTIESHIKFKEKYQLPYELLSDVKGKVIEMYDAKVPILGTTKRITYLLDGELRIKHIYSSMLKFNQHARRILTEL